MFPSACAHSPHTTQLSDYPHIPRVSVAPTSSSVNVINVDVGVNDGRNDNITRTSKNNSHHPTPISLLFKCERHLFMHSSEIPCISCCTKAAFTVRSPSTSSNHEDSEHSAPLRARTAPSFLVTLDVLTRALIHSHVQRQP